MSNGTPTVDQPRAPIPPAQAPPGDRGRAFAVTGTIIVVVSLLVLAAFALLRGDEPAELTPFPPDGTEGPTSPEVRFGEEAPANWDVTGVAADDVLNVRTGPGLHNPVTATLPSGTVELESTGRIASVDGVLWREIKVPGATTGWVNARYLSETRPPALEPAVAAMAARIEAVARAEDWDALAALALEGDTAFTAVFDMEMSAAELAERWRREAAEQPVADILLGLLGLPEWYPTVATDAAGDEVLIYVTPRFMHEPNDPNRQALEAAIGPDRVAASIADGQYLGWRLGITADGDWQFFVRGD